MGALGDQTLLGPSPLRNVRWFTDLTMGDKDYR